MCKNIVSRENVKFVSEIGLNHLGSEKIAVRYCESLVNNPQS